MRTAEVLATLSLATDLAVGMELETGLRSALVATRLAERLRLDAPRTAEAYYVSLLFYVGCTADAEIAAELFPAEEALTKYFAPVMLGSRPQMMAGIVRALGADAESTLGQV